MVREPARSVHLLPWNTGLRQTDRHLTREYTALCTCVAWGKNVRQTSSTVVWSSQLMIPSQNSRWSTHRPLLHFILPSGHGRSPVIAFTYVTATVMGKSQIKSHTQISNVSRKIFKSFRHISSLKSPLSSNPESFKSNLKSNLKSFTKIEV